MLSLEVGIHFHFNQPHGAHSLKN